MDKAIVFDEIKQVIADIVENGVSGLLVAAKRPDQLANAIEKLLADPMLRAKYGAALQTSIQKEFSLPKMISETSALY